MQNRLMQIKQFEPSDAQPLYAYWYRLGAEIPFFFPTTLESWTASLLRDRINGHRLFPVLRTYIATSGGEVKGVVQYGRPRFAFDTSGNPYEDPGIGVIRFLYFDENLPEAGNRLYAQAARGLAGLERQHAFYHVLGLSCHAHHGKLHRSQSHVEALLLDQGFRVEHENAYYILDMANLRFQGASGVTLHETPGASNTVDGRCHTQFVACADGEEIGIAQIFYVDQHTGGATTDAAYLTYIAVVPHRRRQGMGTALIRALADRLVDAGYRYLHLDTAGTNTRAIRFYDKLGFIDGGTTRSYIRIRE